MAISEAHRCPRCGANVAEQGDAKNYCCACGMRLLPMPLRDTAREAIAAAHEAGRAFARAAQAKCEEEFARLMEEPWRAFEAEVRQICADQPAGLVEEYLGRVREALNLPPRGEYVCPFCNAAVAGPATAYAVACWCCGVTFCTQPMKIPLVESSVIRLACPWCETVAVFPADAKVASCAECRKRFSTNTEVAPGDPVYYDPERRAFTTEKPKERYVEFRAAGRTMLGERSGVTEKQLDRFRRAAGLGTLRPDENGPDEAEPSADSEHEAMLRFFKGAG